MSENATDPDAATPAPDLDTVEQQPTPLPVVDVRVVGPAQVQRQPNRLGSIDTVFLPTGGTREQLLSKDLRRARATLICDEAFNVSRLKAGKLVTWPANVPLIVEHGDEMWGSGSDATVGVIAEFYAE